MGSQPQTMHGSEGRTEGSAGVSRDIELSCFSTLWDGHEDVLL